MTSEFRRIFTHSIIYAVGNVLQRAIGLVMIPIYTNVFKDWEYGLISLLEYTVIILQIIVGMQLTMAILRFYSEDKTDEARERVISTSMLFTTFFAAAVCVLGCLFSKDLSRLIIRNTGAAEPFTVMMFVLLFNSMIEVPLVVLRAREKSLVFLTVSIGRFVLACVLNIFFIVILKKGVEGWLLGSLWTSIITCSYLVITTLGSIKKIRFSLPLLKRMIAYTLPLLPVGLAMFWIHNGDRYLLNYYFQEEGLGMVGVYELGYKFAMMITYLIGQPFFLIWSVRMFEVLESKGGEKVYARAFTYFTSVLIMFLVVLCVTVKDLIYILAGRPEYHAAYLFVPLVASGYILREFSDFFKGVLLVKRRTSFVGLNTLIATIVCTVFYILLIPRFKLWGAAWATLFTFATMAFCMLLVSQRIHKVPYEYKRLAIMIGLALILIGCLNSFSIGDLYADLILKAILSLSFYPLLYRLGFFTDEEKEKIAAWFGRATGFLRGGNNNN